MNFSDQGTLVVVLKYSQKLSRTNFAFIEKLFSHCFEIDLKQSFISVLQSPSIKLLFASSLSRVCGGVWWESDLLLRKLCKTQLAGITFCVLSGESSIRVGKTQMHSLLSFGLYWDNNYRTAGVLLGYARHMAS